MQIDASHTVWCTVHSVVRYMVKIDNPRQFVLMTFFYELTKMIEKQQRRARKTVTKKKGDNVLSRRTSVRKDNLLNVLAQLEM